MPTCPLCASPDSRLFHRDARRDYYRCGNCRLAFVPPEQHLSPEQEKAVYDQHENHPDDPGYRRFLARLFVPLRSRLTPGARGLDFGAGPGPTLSLMFEEAGHPMAIYDPFYAPDPAVLERRYDFVTATEVVEHLFEPGRELERLAAMLPEGGWLGLMTKRMTDEAAFARWHYILDPTHVCFFSEASFEWLAQRLGMSVEFPAADVALLQQRSVR
ncbi:class I SAM-dependent methyltransferase [Halomonas sp. MCCC 1A17488]|uniref:Class I SAM-dependent methyltransferase n=1 Tax=Billgrantia sulfidoxydans TaxID=2733484 RepID=A0ABX7W3P0_9GAMM|nr:MULTISPECIES: class I SAM-dependent methyltransferase [Halomonas]MCE8016027.1 class I SAM-dependent methyltransferase [Halomonas sp. MCCC 1A17488]MCG3239360.1 class I SAM-dependent methyltransferase [Halomonas sp. MCCC 1A17488]QPP50710.1 class I SAM-dependent methyltransferase [Halomonas sp. SS10-MC5]QTP54287.1 class I SAM-dependent methyltransferase [Halomonas sulfidoxydans]